MNSEKYIGLDVHQATISVAVLDSTGKLVMESILETKAATILQFFAGLRGTLSVTFEEGPAPPGYTICSNPTSPNCWCVTRGRTHGSKPAVRSWWLSTPPPGLRGYMTHGKDGSCG
jgi:hypothetical protein